MILIDANILVYSHVSTFAQHEHVRRWFDERLTGTAAVGIPWVSFLAFLRLVTNPRIFDRPEPMGDAWRQVEDWLGCDSVWLPQPAERHAALLGDLLRAPGVTANLVPDAHLAALALEHGLQLCSTDGDFARFPGLRWLNPLDA